MSEKYEDFDQGNAYVKEHTGSATRINVDGQWEHNFVDDEEPFPAKEKKIEK